MDLEKLREELDKIFTYKIMGVEGVETLLFYKLIADLHEGKAVEADKERLTDYLKGELKCLIEYYKNPISIGAYKFASHCIETQIIILDKRFPHAEESRLSVLRGAGCEKAACLVVRAGFVRISSTRLEIY